MLEKKKRRIAERRKFSKEFKLSIVKDYEDKKHTALELSRLFDLSIGGVYNWIYKYSTYNKKTIRIVEMSQSSTQKVKALENRIKELERIVGQKQISIDYLECLVEVAKEELGIDIKKNFATQQSDVSGKGKSK